MSNVFVISDLHLSHNNILSFKDGDKPLRPFSSMEEMNEHIVERWNSVVSVDDTVFNLGDVVFAQTGFDYLPRLNGNKILCMGNHCAPRYSADRFLKYFSKVTSYIEYKGGILSHIPIHTSQLERYKWNICGHLHSNRVMMDVDGKQVEDPRYFCASVEQINYTPILLDDIIEIFKGRGII